MMKMIPKYLAISVILLNVCQQLVLAEDEDEDKECPCIDMDMETFTTCKDWEDAPVQVDVTITINDNHGTLSGKIIVGKEISTGVEIEIIIFVVTPNGEEVVYSTGASICHSLKDDKAPWWPIVQVFNTTECPIAKGEYKVEGVVINLSGMKSFFTKDFIGQYNIAISAELAIEKFWCFILGIEIFEETRLLSQCPNPQDEC